MQIIQACFIHLRIASQAGALNLFLYLAGHIGQQEDILNSTSAKRQQCWSFNMIEQSLLARLESKDRKIKAQQTEINKALADNKALAGLNRSLKKRNKLLKALLSKIADVTKDGHDKIEAWRAIAEDCKHLD